MRRRRDLPCFFSPSLFGWRRRRRLEFVAEAPGVAPVLSRRSLMSRLRGRAPSPAGHSRLDSTLRTGTFVVLGSFLLLALRLMHLQIISGEQYYRKSTDNFVKELERPAVRGQIRDRKGQVLAENRPSYSVYITPRYLTEDALLHLKRYLDLSEEHFASLKARVEAPRGLERYRALLAFEDISRDQMAMLESEKQLLPGIDVEVRAHRHYPGGSLGAHMLGYLNMISAEELKKHAKDGYHAYDYIGRSGLERLFERQLRGVSGFEKVIVDARGRRKSNDDIKRLLIGESTRDPVPGDNVVLTIDAELQRILMSALSKHRSGAAAVVEVDTGKVLAIGSHPGPDPNVLTGRLSRAEAERLAVSPFRPLLDKTLRENYYPGSTFKVVPALLALEDRLINPEEKVTCHGRYPIGKRVFHCMKSHGPVNLHEAVVQSCNVYFYHLAEKPGMMDRMAQLGRQLGFGAPTGIGLSEVPGFLPTQAFYRAQKGGFLIGHALNTALGQGDVKVTPLQLAMAYAALANGGKLYKPMLVERVESPSGQVKERYQPVLRAHLSVSPDSLERLRRALHGVVNETKGTAYDARVEGLDVAGKSGTAQVRKNKKGEAPGWDVTNDHAWFTGFSPSRRAKIAVVVLVEHGGLGGHVAAPTAMEIISGYFNLVAPEQRPRVAVEIGPPRTRGPMPAASGVH